MIYLIATIAALTGFLFGFDEGIMSGVLPAIQKDFNLNAAETGFMMGLLPFGALLSSAITGKLSDWLGRLSILHLVPIVFTIAILMIVFTESYQVLYCARFLLGISIGMSMVVSPMYIAETAPKEIRGKLITCFQLAITIGILTAYVLNLINAFNAAIFPWRWMFCTGLIPAAALFFGSLLLLESPRWLCANKKKAKAEQVLHRLFRSPSRVEQELVDIELAIKKGRTQKKPWKYLISPQVRPALALGVLLFFFQQLSGINVIIYYAPIIFNELQLGSSMASLMATVGVGTLNVLMTFLAMRWVEKMGRRPLLMLGFIGAAISLFVIAVIAFFDIQSLNWFSAVCIFIYIAFFAVSLGPLPWVMTPEIFPLKVRGEGASCSAASNWLFNTLVVATFPVLLHSVGIGITFACYSASCVLGYLFSLRYAPETKNLSLEKIEEHLHSRKPFRMLGRKH